MNEIQKIKKLMLEYFKGDPKRINHLIKVYSYASIIGEEEKISEKEFYCLKIASLVHDIGIKNSELKYSECNGKQQEIEGPPEAERLLISAGIDSDVIERVKYLVGNHHTYKNVEGMDYQILIEADFIVNFYEDNSDVSFIEKIEKKIFKTKTGKMICEKLFY